MPLPASEGDERLRLFKFTGHFLAGLATLITGSDAAAQTTDTASLTVALCSSDQQIGEALFREVFFTPDGISRQLVVLDRATADACVQNSVGPLATTELQWAGLAPANQLTRDTDTVLLQGSFADTGIAINEIILPDAGRQSTDSEALPFNANVLPEFTARVFGAEERVSWEDETLVCSDGQQLAGVFLQSTKGWPGDTPIQLEIAATGSGSFAVAIGDDRRNASEQPLELGRIDAGTRISYAFDVVGDEGETWNSLTLICPAAAGRLQIQAVVMHPATSAASARIPVAHPRSAWLWSAELWQQQPESIWALQQQQRLGDVYVTVPTTDGGEVQNARALRNFLQQANSRKLRVWAVIGDRHDVLPDTRESLRGRLDAYLDYNRGAPEDARLAGVQLDIEPYLLPGFALAQAEWRDRYLEVVAAAQQQLNDELRLDLVMPQWWGSHASWGKTFLDALTPSPQLGITVMNYQTDAAALRESAQAFLAWGQTTNVPVRIALETGQLADEQRRRYVADTSGELWLLQLGEQPVLLLFSAAQSGLPGRAYRFQQQSEVRAANYSFAGNPERLRAVIAELEPEWSGWSSFSGIALHGLEETLPGQGPGN